MIYCVKCRAQLPDDADFCPKCGLPQRNIVGAYHPKPSVVVTNVERRRVPVNVIQIGNGRDENWRMNYRLVVDGVEIGVPIREYRSHTYPKEIEVVAVDLSDGKRVALASEEIRYWTINQARKIVGHRTERKVRSQVYLPTRAKIGERQYSFHQALGLRRARAARAVEGKREQPFRLDEAIGMVTNGDVRIPLRRPWGREEWENWPRIAPLQAITEANWELMLEVIVGLYLNEVLDLAALRDRVAKERHRRQEQERAGRRLATLLSGQCYDGESASTVSIGANLIFSLELRDGERVHLVDSPEYGRGLYVFDTYKDAHDWATRAIDKGEARRKAKAFIPHTEGWRTRLDRVVAQIGKP